MTKDGAIEQIRKYPSPNNAVELFEVLYWSCGLRVKGLLAKPKNVEHPEALLYLRGGMQSIGMVRAARIAQFAMQGFVVFAPYYRGNRGGEGKDEFAGADRFDAIYGADVLKQLSGRDKLHVYGFSRGGLMALWTSIYRDDIVSVVCWAGVSDAVATYRERVDMRRGLRRVIGGTPNKYPERYEARTPLYEIERITAPVFIAHGEQDQHVSIEHAYKLEAALRGAGKKVEVKYAVNTPHHYSPKFNREMVRMICQWMLQQ
ncbi:MAG: prolyl oligopeptidase family serine peptidase [Lysinibacillus sp.]